MQYPDSHPYFQYRNTPVGEQLLRHYAARDAVRHSTPLLPIRLADIGRFVMSLFGRRGQDTRTA